MRRKALRVAAVVAAVLFLIGAGFRFYTGTDDFAALTGKKATALATELLATRVEVGGVRVNSLRAVTAERFAVYDKQNKKLVEAESAEVRFSLFSLLFGKSVSAISEVVITKPHVWLEQRSDGKWNYEDLLQEESEDSGFRGKAIVKDGCLDLALNDAAKPLKIMIDDINATVKFKEKAFEIETTANCNGEPISINGDIDTHDKPMLNLLVKSEGFDIGKVMNDIPYQGKVVVNAQLAGTPDALDMRGDLSAETGSVYGYDFKNAKAKVAFAENILTVYELTGDVLGGKLETSMELSTDDLSFDGTAKFTDLNSALLGETLPDIAGRVTADLGFKGIGGNSDELSIFGSLSGQGLTYKNIETAELYTSFAKLQRDIEIDYLSIHFPNGGTLGVEGAIKCYNDLDLKFYAARIDLGKLQNIDSRLDIQGHSDFRGKLKGNTDNPELWLEFAAINGALFKQPFKTLHGEAAGSLDGIVVKNFALENGAQDVWTVKGSVGFTGEKRVNLQIDTVGARMEDLAALIAPDQPITGNLDNIIFVTGTLDNPDIVGYVHLYHGSYNGYLLQGMDGDYTMKNGKIALQDFHVFSPLIDMELNGTIDKEHNLDMKVIAKDLSLDRFGRKLPYPINGHGRFDGHIGGSLNNPLFDGLLTAGELDFNGVKIERASGKVNYRNGSVYFRDFGFDQNGGHIGLTASANINTLAVNGSLEAKNVDLNSLLAMANLKNNPLNGRFNGAVYIGGKATALQAHIMGRMDKGDIKGYEIHDLLLDAYLNGKVLTLSNFTGKQGLDGTLVATGQIDFNGPLDLKISAQAIQAGILTKAAGLDVDLSGNMNIDITAHGVYDNPQAEASLEISNGGARGASFDRITGLFSFKNHIINVDQFIIDKDHQGHSYKLTAYGTVPLAALMAEKESTGEEQFNLRVSLDQADMSLLPMIAPGVDWALGETKGSLLFTGTMARPLVHGSVILKDGAMKLKALGLPITDMKADLNFAGDSFMVEECSGKIGKGQYQLTGGVRLDGRQLTDYGLKFTGTKLDIVSDFYKGPLTFDVNVSEGVFYKQFLPKVSGRVFIEDATISIPSVPESEGELPEFIVDLALDLGKKVRFYSPYVGDLRLDGSAHFGGTTKYPNSSGHIAVSRGKVYYLKTPFTVRRGALIFNNAGSFLPSADFFADTKLDRTKVWLSINGPIDQMKLRLRSVPEMRQSDIIKLLTFKTAPKGNGDQALDYSSVAEIGLQMAFLSELEGQIRNFLNLDEFSVSRDWDSKKNGDNFSKEGYNIEVGKYISEKVMLKYIQGVAGSTKRRYGVQYDFNDRISATVLHDEYNAYRFGLEARFGF